MRLSDKKYSVLCMYVSCHVVFSFFDSSAYNKRTEVIHITRPFDNLNRRKQNLVGRKVPNLIVDNIVK